MRKLVVAAFATLLTVPVFAMPGENETADETIAIKAGRIITVSGKEIKNGVILIRGGKIVAVGQDVKIPDLATVIDASKQVVVPGYVEAHTSRGVDRANERMPSVPFVSVFDSINPVAPYFEDALRQGITTVFVMPGNNTLIGGQGVVVRPYGVTVEEMLVARDIAMKISLSPTRGRSRMAHLAALRRELDGALRKMRDAKGVTPTTSKGRKPPKDPKQEALVRLLKGEIPVFVYCAEASDVLKAVEIQKRYKFKMQLVVGRNAWKASDVLARLKKPIIIDPQVAYWETDPKTHEEILRVPPALYHKAGVKVAYQTNSSSLGSAYLWYQAAIAVKHGVPREEALKAITLYPAQILGLGDRLGSIEKGKDANLVILTGDPLDAMTWVDRVVLEGKVVYERSKDTKLKRILGKKND